MSQSACFKSLDRQKPPAWSNRFRRDVNDLMYNKKDLRDIQYMKRSTVSKASIQKARNIKSQRNFRQTSNVMKNAMQKYNIVPYDATNSNRNNKIKRSTSTHHINNPNPQPYNEQTEHTNPEQTLQSAQRLKQRIYRNPSNRPFLTRTDFLLTPPDPQLHPIPHQDNYGLCPFQFQTTTITGNIHSRYLMSIKLRSGNNLRLQKSTTHKKPNINPVFYDRHTDVSLEEYDRSRQVRMLAGFRDFSSYSAHKVFLGRAEAGGVHDVGSRQMDLVRRKISLQLDFGKMTPRPDITTKLGTQLQYKGYHNLIASNNKHRPLYDVQTAERQLVIGKQVISYRRGCFR